MQVNLPRNKQSILSFVFLPFLLFYSFFSMAFSPLGVKVVVIDAGHGGKDPGCSGKTNNERDIALSVALKLGNFIETNCKDTKVIYTRKTDVFVELQERAEIANRNKANLFISIIFSGVG